MVSCGPTFPDECATRSRKTKRKRPKVTRARRDMVVPDHTPTATITGIVAGFLVSIPVGPINLTIINEGARRGFKWALMIGLGSVLMESIYCAMALTGFAAFLGLPVVKAAMELLSFLFLLFLSW